MSAVLDYFKGLKKPQTTSTAISAPAKKQLPQAKTNTNVSAFFANLNKPAPTSTTPVPVTTPAPTPFVSTPTSAPVIAVGPRRSLLTPLTKPSAMISAPTAEQSARMDAIQAQHIKKLEVLKNKKPDSPFVAGAKQIARTPLEFTSNLNQFFENASKKRGAVNLIQQTGATAVSQMSDAAKFVVDYIDNNPTKLLGPVSILIPKDNPIDQASRASKQKLKAEGKDTFANIAEYAREGIESRNLESEAWQEATTKEKFTKYLPETIYNIAPSVGGSVLPYLMSGGLGFVTAVGSTAEDVKQKAIEDGIDERQAENLALGTGLAVGTLDRIIPNKVLSPNAKKNFIGGLFKRMVKSGVGEPLTEVAQENIQIAAEATFREDLGWDEIKARNAMSALGGLFGGAGMQSVGSIADVVAGRKEAPGALTPASTALTFVERDGEMVPIAQAPIAEVTPATTETALPETASNVQKVLNEIKAKTAPQTTGAEQITVDQRLVDLAGQPSSQTQSKVILDETADPEVIQKLQSEAGVDVTGYRHSVDNYGIQHTLREHGNDPIPVTSQDIGLIPDIIKNYDGVNYEGKTKIGQPAIKYTKRYNGTTFFVEEIRTGRGELAFKTMYKQKTPRGASDALLAPPSIRPPQAEPTPVGVSGENVTDSAIEVNQPANPKIPAQRVAPIAATPADAVVATESRAPVPQPAPVRKITLEDTPLHNRIMSELLYAEKGERYAVRNDGLGASLEFRGKKSTFPKWVPANLRSRKLFDVVLEHITNGTIPTKAAELRLYKIVAGEMQAQNDVINDAEWVARERNNIINPLASDEENAAALAKFDEQYAKLKANQISLPDTGGTEVQEVGQPIQAESEQVSEASPAEPATAPVEPTETVQKPAEEAPKSEPAPEVPKAPTKLASAVYERLKAEDPNLTEDVTYEVQNLRENAEKAVQMIEDDRTEAYRVAMGVSDPPAGQTATAVNIALAEKALEDGNHTLYAQLIRQRSLEQTRRGQELVAEKGSVTDNSVARYTKELVKARLEKLGRSYLGILNDSKLRKSKNSRATAAIDNEVAKVRNRIKSTKEIDLDAAQSFLDSLACK